MMHTKNSSPLWNYLLQLKTIKNWHLNSSFRSFLLYLRKCITRKRWFTSALPLSKEPLCTLLYGFASSFFDISHFILEDFSQWYNNIFLADYHLILCMSHWNESFSLTVFYICEGIPIIKGIQTVTVGARAIHR